MAQTFVWINHKTIIKEKTSTSKLTEEDKAICFLDFENCVESL